MNFDTATLSVYGLCNGTTDGNSDQYKLGCIDVVPFFIPSGLRECPVLPEIRNGSMFFVAGSSKTEVANTGIPCDGTTDGNSCHYMCDQGYRLSGSPIMLCNASGQWEGTVPSCEGEFLWH